MLNRSGTASGDGRRLARSFDSQPTDASNSMLEGPSIREAGTNIRVVTRPAYHTVRLGPPVLVLCLSDYAQLGFFEGGIFTEADLHLRPETDRVTLAGETVQQLRSETFVWIGVQKGPR